MLELPAKQGDEDGLHQSKEQLIASLWGIGNKRRYVGGAIIHMVLLVSALTAVVEDFL